MSDLLAELREHERDYPTLIHGPLCGKAADEIERLREQLVKRSAALQKVADLIDEEDAFEPLDEAISIAKAALTDDSEKKSVGGAMA